MIREVCEGVHAHLLSALERLGETARPTLGIGEAAAFESGAFPRIVWIPRSGRADNWIGLRGADFKKNPGALWSRNLQLEVRIWDESIDAVERLAERLIQSIHFMTTGSYSLIGEEWDTSSSQQSGIMGVFTFQIQMPFCRETNPEIKIDKPTITPAVVTS